MRKYPRIGEVYKRQKNTSAKCKCGEVGKFKTAVQVSYMRGDDEVFWACDPHKRDLEFLTNSQ